MTPGFQEVGTDIAEAWAMMFDEKRGHGWPPVILFGEVAYESATGIVEAAIMDDRKAKSWTIAQAGHHDDRMG